MPIPKGASASSFPSEDHPVSITPIFCKIFERLLTKMLSIHCDKFSLLPDCQFGFHNDLGACYAFLTLDS